MCHLREGAFDRGDGVAKVVESGIFSCGFEGDELWWGWRVREASEEG